MLSTTIGRLRLLGLLEGISFLLLLGICVPLKYVAGIPEPVSVVGMAHGILFIAYVLWVFIATSEYNWNFKTVGYSIVAAVLPFGTFVADKKIFKLHQV